MTILDAVVSETQTLPKGGEDSMYLKSFGIILAEKWPPNGSTVQAQLVHMKLAKPAGPR